MQTAWRECADSLDVSNVFVYVGDAVRWDFTPAAVLERGLSCETIAASTHSPSSFASLVTGWSPPRHGVTNFEDRLPGDAIGLFDLPGFDSRFVNAVRDQPSDDDPLYSVLDTQPPEIDHPFDDVNEPFAVLERGPGGHAPYGDFDGTAWEYFEDRGGQPANEYRNEYTVAVETDADRFANRLEELAERGLRDDTLVVYTSDHGELLGELGLLGHNGPMHPALVRVPTVFVHPTLPNAQVTDGVFRHVDVLPTIVEWLEAGGSGKDRDVNTDGIGLLDRRIPKYGESYYDSRLPTSVAGVSGRLRYEGVWDFGGGHVFARSPTHERLTALAGKLLKSPKRGFLRANAVSAVRAYAAGNRTFDTPSVQRPEADDLLRAARKAQPRTRSISLNTDQREHLEELGYLS